MRATMKAFDAPASKKEVIVGLAAEAAKHVNAAKRIIDDPDDACEAGGRAFRQWLESIAYDPLFVREVNMQIGSNAFNSEFFVDGLVGEK